MDNFEHVYIIIDALDECTDSKRLLVWIDEISQWSGSKVHILLSSRPEADIEERFGCLHRLRRVPLVGDSIDADIETYLDAMLAEMIRWDAQTRAHVRGILLGGADGM